MTRIGVVAFVAFAVFLSACSAGVLALDVGSCFDDPADIAQVGASDIVVVDCDTPHDNEVFANVVLTGDEFPGSEVVADRALAQCVDAFGPYVGTAYETSVYDILWVGPSQETWDVGDRVVICAAFDPGGAKTTGPIQGIGR